MTNDATQTAGIHFPTTPFPLDRHLVLLGRRGSESHGLYVPSTDPDSIDDRDLMGVVITPAEYYLGLRQWEGAEAINGVWDVVLYELRKFVNLLCKQNANVLSLLWLDREDYLPVGPRSAIDPCVGPFIENRSLFRHAERARRAFVGYALGQLKRMTAFDRDAMQTIADIEARLVDHGVDLGHAAEGKLESERPVVQALIDRYVGMRRTYHKAYMGAKRWALVQKIGYDAKNAAHMIRLLHMAHEYLTEGVLHVRRVEDRDLLLSIKRGEWTIDEVHRHADACFDAIESARNVLPESIDMDLVERMTIDAIERKLKIQHGTV